MAGSLSAYCVHRSPRANAQQLLFMRLKVLQRYFIKIRSKKFYLVAGFAFY